MTAFKNWSLGFKLYLVAKIDGDFISNPIQKFLLLHVLKFWEHLFSLTLYCFLFAFLSIAYHILSIWSSSCKCCHTFSFPFKKNSLHDMYICMCTQSILGIFVTQSFETLTVRLKIYQRQILFSIPIRKNGPPYIREHIKDVL